jgi:hypothetical protein
MREASMNKKPACEVEQLAIDALMQTYGDAAQRTTDFLRALEGEGKTNQQDGNADPAD